MSGTVILASDIITDVKVAIKVIHMPSQQKKELVLKELQVLGMMPQLLCYFEGKLQFNAIQNLVLNHFF